METENTTEGLDDRAERQVHAGRRPNDLKGNPLERLERAVARLRHGIWILAIFTVLVCAFSVANLMLAKRAFEGVQRHVVLIGELSESVKEIANTTAQLKKMIEELSDSEEGGNQEDQPQTWNGKI